jgi:hypothetical protein
MLCLIVASRTDVRKGRLYPWARLLHIATVHWRSERWIGLQLGAFERHAGEPYRVYAFLDGVSSDHTGRLDFVSLEPIVDHATKLNRLAETIASEAASDDDLLLFVDGDAFPISPLGPLIGERLPEHRLIAVQRFENNGDLQPHPCFCLTTVGFWNKIGGDWRAGATWLDLDGAEITDVGGNLLSRLDRAGAGWHHLRRLNARNPHPVLFGVYGDASGPIAYHHGGGFRAGGGRIDRVLADRQAKVEPESADLLLARARARADQLKQEWLGRFARDPEAWRALI